MKLTPTFKDQVEANGGAPLGPIQQAFANGQIPQWPGLDSPQIVQPSLTIEPEAKPQPPLKVALVGTAPSSRMLAPYNDPSWQIWACSPGNMNVIPRADVWFEIHGNLLWPENISYGGPYIEWLKTLPIPVYAKNKDLIPNATPFPFDEMVAEFGRNFFTSSFAWMLAKAISDMTKAGGDGHEIALYGIDMASKEEYILQRPGFFYFKEKAEERGIKVWAPNESDILQHPPLYGKDDTSPFLRKVLARDQELIQRINGLNNEVAQLNAQLQQKQMQIQYLMGAREDLDYWKNIWGGVEVRR